MTEFTLTFIKKNKESKTISPIRTKRFNLNDFLKMNDLEYN